MDALWASKDSLADRRVAEEHWRTRVSASKLRFDLAVAQMDQATREPGDAMKNLARTMAEQARAQYQCDLQIFTDLIVRGKLPATALAPEDRPKVPSEG